jgi:4-hydroxy-4-methyl-2-oxoglutarate aldolase
MLQGEMAPSSKGGWTPAKYDALAKWIDAHPEKLKMTRDEFNQELARRKTPRAQ